MARFLRSHGVMVGLALALMMAAPLATGAAGAEHESGGERRWVDVILSNIGAAETGRRGVDACDNSNPIRMTTDGANEAALDDSAGGRPEKLQGAHNVRPQPAGSAERAAEEAAAPADGPSACGSASLAVSFLMCMGMALVGLLAA